MEKPPTFENKETPEEQLISILKEKGIANPEAKELLINWTIQQEKEVEASADPEASIQFNLKRARLYFKAGYIEAALENFDDAMTQAWHEERKELYIAIEKEKKEIEASLNK
jgi:hypothetical protein